MDRPTLERCVILVSDAYEAAKKAPTMPAAADIMEAAVLKVIETADSSEVERLRRIEDALIGVIAMTPGREKVSAFNALAKLLESNPRPPAAGGQV